MDKLTEHAELRVMRRLEIEAIIAGYPDISDDELKVLRDWFKREASALDVALVASNTDIREAYVVFRKEHIDRFTAADWLRGFAFAATVCIVVFGLAGLGS